MFYKKAHPGSGSMHAELPGKAGNSGGKQNRNIFRGGFSLIELMVVLVIIALLASLVGINVQGYLDSARQRKARADLAILHNQVKAYYADHGRYPTTSEGLEALTPKYVELLSKDPWGRAYQYEQPGRERAFDIICFGADGREGGDESDRDLTNWTINDPEDDS